MKTKYIRGLDDRYDKALFFISVFGGIAFILAPPSSLSAKVRGFFRSYECVLIMYYVDTGRILFSFSFVVACGGCSTKLPNGAGGHCPSTQGNM